MLSYESNETDQSFRAVWETRTTLPYISNPFQIASNPSFAGKQSLPQTGRWFLFVIYTEPYFLLLDVKKAQGKITFQSKYTLAYSHLWKQFCSAN